MAQLDQKYDDLIKDVLENGTDSGDRTGTGTRFVFGRQVRFDVDLGAFPIITEKHIVWNSVLTELVWFVRGGTNIEYLNENDVHIWDEWANENGEVGPVYGYQWRNWNGDGIDQLQGAIDTINENPNSRRIMVSAWNPAQIDRMGLPPCHFQYQFRSEPTPEGEPRKLHVLVSQRSADAALGMPFNWTSYATLLAVIAQITDHEPGEVIWQAGDTHIYHNHLEEAKQILELDHYEAPKLEIDSDMSSIDDFDKSSVRLEGYQSGPFVKLPVAV